MTRVLATVCLVALLGATAAAYAVTNGAKLEPSPILLTKPPVVFSPACNCDTALTSIDFRLRKAERLTVWVTHDGKRVRTLVTARTFPRGLVQIPFDGISEEGITLPAGTYRAVVRLGEAHRTIALPYAIPLDLSAAGRAGAAPRLPAHLARRRRPQGLLHRALPAERARDTRSSWSTDGRRW